MLPADVLEAVTDATLTARTLHDKLRHHIEQHDANAALAYVTQSGRVDVDAKDSKLIVTRYLEVSQTYSTVLVDDLAILPLDTASSFLKLAHPLGTLFLLENCFVDDDEFEDDGGACHEKSEDENEMDDDDDDNDDDDNDDDDDDNDD
jgi:hypothetical protein